MKDFKAAASRMAGEFYASDDMSHNVLCEKCMEYGYSEAMKEQREFYLKVSSYMMELELYLSKTGESDYILLESLHTDVLKHLSSFTEQEQSTK
jgi:hypothetical protein